MAQSTYIQRGDAIDYTPGAAVAAGEVILQGDLIGIARTPIAASTPGALAINGVFDVLKTAAQAYTVGQILYWDDTTKRVTSTASTNKIIGKCVLIAASADTAVRIVLNR